MVLESSFHQGAQSLESIGSLSQADHKGFVDVSTGLPGSEDRHGFSRGLLCRQFKSKPASNLRNLYLPRPQNLKAETLNR